MKSVACLIDAAVQLLARVDPDARFASGDEFDSQMMIWHNARATIRDAAAQNHELDLLALQAASDVRLIVEHPDHGLNPHELAEARRIAAAVYALVERPS